MSSRFTVSRIGASMALGGATLLTVIACGSSSDRAFDTVADASVIAPMDAAQPDGTCGARRCSRDLRTVLSGCEGSETVVERCGDDFGCGNGACVEACASAELSKGSLGCSFYALPPDDDNGGACFVAMIANTWPRPVTIRGELGGEPLDISKSIYFVDETSPGAFSYSKVEGALPPGKVALVFLSRRYDGYACPEGVETAFLGDPIVHRTNITRAFHLTTDAPVSAYSIFPYGGADSYTPTATLLLPTSSWGTNYLAAMPENPEVRFDDARFQGGPRFLQIVANEDDTEVRLQPKVTINPGGLDAGAPASQVGAWKLSRGQVLQLTQQFLEKANGSPLESNKPVGLFGGSDCTNFPAGNGYCDASQQQIPPVASWGNEYALVPYKPRLPGEAVFYSVIGAADGTLLTYEPTRPRNAPETLAAGESVSFKSDVPLTVRSQDDAHPFYAAVYMTGARYNGDVDHPHDFNGAGIVFGVGDPDYVNLVPAKQFLDHYVFFVDYTYPLSTLSIVRKKNGDHFSPVELDCAGEISDFQPLGTSGEYEYAWFDLTTNFAPTKTPLGECKAGRHEAKSDGPFTITVWGMGLCASYGYPVGTGVRPLNEVVVPIR
ncbi:hypothetical protein AKJ09_02533 [Labilithrix luteola]|uniref:IgGFc-binding protein N-terminal domain-containing protein n=1 Tax=Labilithrix luteola TaxID=1391654 RepID=A0A0K1PRW8_9BACT|nr:IgGFc-binding protein [Labilithrix luteola]AKU95869.1 hypothetical protein AKJ09_02533 [Labilithrix luteola]